MQLTLRHDLAFVTASLTYRGATVSVPVLLVDTGAASTVINADLAADAGVFLEPGDRLRTLRGVGGREYVFVRDVDRLAIGAHGLDDFEVEIGELDYGLEIGGILGMDFLCTAGAVVDLDRMMIEFRRQTRGP
ncbi:MAG TPA: retropepsin-like aspartic protease [Vicinamibacterales bacterium]|nr:retropepsin-like aspartic protease [Vicinamibacterales bacterium]